MRKSDKIKSELDKLINREKVLVLKRFFKTSKGEYGEGDVFLGITVPNQRKVANFFYEDTTFKDLETLLHDQIHEYRLTALIMLVYKYENAQTEQEKEKIVKFYLKNLEHINNWDLVDISAPKILGTFLFNKNRTILYDLARSENLWKQRIAVISTFYFIKNSDFPDTLDIAEILLTSKHDLIHKAVGWMLREVGKKDLSTEMVFLKAHYRSMPRTMLRYSIERLEPELRKKFIKGLI